jgi:hypothetical protein
MMQITAAYQASGVKFLKRGEGVLIRQYIDRSDNDANTREYTKPGWNDDQQVDPVVPWLALRARLNHNPI